jgi:4-hydroxythreonine-4-phosphate dehydrogenase
MTGSPRLAPIALTMGEPAGIGGEIARTAWLRRNGDDIPSFLLIDDPDRLEITSPDEANAVFADAIPVLRQSLPVPVAPGQPDPANTNAVLASIDRAVTLCKARAVCAMVTNPIHKAALYAGGFRHPGHTEYLADLAGVPRTVMMLAGGMTLAEGGLRAIPVTVHTSLRDAISTLTSDLIVETARILNADLKRYFGIAAPRIAVAGLNPHAGEGGALGEEEQTILAPALDQLRAEGLTILGPLPADTMFHAQARATYDAALCMYHDQALIPVKTLDFHGGVNVTLGLPFIRTSPDHGTAFKIAGTGIARPDSLISALRLAATMARTQS